MRPRKEPTSSASFGTVQPSEPKARRNPSSLKLERIDQVSGVATPGSASPTFTFDQTMRERASGSTFFFCQRRVPGSTAVVTGRAWST